MLKVLITRKMKAGRLENTLRGGGRGRSVYGIDCGDGRKLSQVCRLNIYSFLYVNRPSVKGSSSFWHTEGTPPFMVVAGVTIGTRMAPLGGLDRARVLKAFTNAASAFDDILFSSAFFSASPRGRGLEASPCQWQGITLSSVVHHEWVLSLTLTGPRGGGQRRGAWGGAPFRCAEIPGRLGTHLCPPPPKA